MRMELNSTQSATVALASPVRLLPQPALQTALPTSDGARFGKLLAPADHRLTRERTQGSCSKTGEGGSLTFNLGFAKPMSSVSSHPSSCCALQTIYAVS